MTRSLLRTVRWLPLLITLAACDEDPTGILVEVRIDDAIDIPGEIARMDILAQTDDGTETISQRAWIGTGLRRSGTFGVRAGSSKTATVKILGYLLATEEAGVRTTKMVTAKMVPGKVVKVPLVFEAECLGTVCCTRGGEADDSPCFDDETPDCRTPTGGGDAACWPAEECGAGRECGAGFLCENALCIPTSGADAGEPDAT